MITGGVPAKRLQAMQRGRGGERLKNTHGQIGDGALEIRDSAMERGAKGAMRSGVGGDSNGQPRSEDTVTPEQGMSTLGCSAERNGGRREGVGGWGGATNNNMTRVFKSVIHVFIRLP